MAQKRYVRITYLPAGSDKPRTCWAEKVGEHRYFEVKRDGDPWCKKKGAAKHLIIGDGDIEEKPARMNLHYAQLELVDAA